MFRSPCAPAFPALFLLCQAEPGRRHKVAGTDGPFVETKETLGGILLLEARDLNHAIALMSKHPAVGMGNIFEIRPANEAMNRLVAERSAAFAKEAHKGK
jgi:hypothetical protein